MYSVTREVHGRVRCEATDDDDALPQHDYHSKQHPLEFNHVASEIVFQPLHPRTPPPLNATDAQTFRQAAGTGLHISIDRPSLQFAMSVVMSGMSEPKVFHQL